MAKKGGPNRFLGLSGLCPWHPQSARCLFAGTWGAPMQPVLPQLRDQAGLGKLSFLILAGEGYFKSQASPMKFRSFTVYHVKSTCHHFSP